MRISFKFYFVFILTLLFCIIVFAFLLNTVKCIPDPTQYGFKKVDTLNRNVLLIASCSKRESNDSTIHVDFLLTTCDASKSNKFTPLCRLAENDTDLGKMYYVTPIVTAVSADSIFAFIGIDGTIYKLNLNKLNDIEKFDNIDFKISLAYDLHIFKASKEKIYAVYYNRKLQKNIYCVWDFKNKQLTKSEDYYIHNRIVYNQVSKLQYFITNHGLELLPDRIKSIYLDYIDYQKGFGWLFSKNLVNAANENLDENLNDKIMYSNGNGEKTIATGTNAVWGNKKQVFFIKSNKDLCFINLDNKNTKTIFRKENNWRFADPIVTNNDRTLLVLHFKSLFKSTVVVFDLLKKEYVIIDTIPLNNVTAIIKGAKIRFKGLKNKN